MSHTYRTVPIPWQIRQELQPFIVRHHGKVMKTVHECAKRQLLHRCHCSYCIEWKLVQHQGRITSRDLARDIERQRYEESREDQIG